MPVNVTGGKYAVASLSAVNTRTISVSNAPPFVLADFNIQRIVGLWDSTGNTFKGFAYARKWVSTSSLELNTPFIDPATGLEVTQVVGDTVLVSKNFAESVAAGLAVSGSTVTLTDSLILGTAGQSRSLCLYDEAKVINSSVGGSILAIQAAGGLAVLGQLQSYGERRTGKSCSLFFNGASGYGVVMTNAAAIWCMFGGSIEGTNGSWNGGYGGTSPNLQLWMNVVTGREFISPGAGGNWTNPTRQMLVNCTAIGGGILVRWGNGSIIGGSFKMPVFAASPFAMFGSDTAGTYTISAPAGTRLIVNFDGKPSGATGVPALWRSSPTVAQTINFINVLSYDKRAISGSGANHAAANQKIYFNDTYSNLVAETVGVVLDNIGIAASTASVSGSWSPVLLHEIWNGINKTTTYGPWAFGLKAYGYNPVAGSFATTSYQLEGTLTANNVAFGGVVNQLADAAVTLSKSAALALSSKFAAVSTGNGTLTVTGNATLDEVYDYLIAWGCSSVALAQFPSLSTYPATASGTALSTAMSIVVNAGVTLSAGIKFKTIATTGGVTLTTGGALSGLEIVGDVSQPTPSDLSGIVITGNLTYNQATNITVTLTDTTITGTVSNSGAGVVSISPAGTTSVGTAGANVVVLTIPKYVNITGLVAGSRVQIYNATTSTILENVEAAGTSHSYVISAASGEVIRLRVTKKGYLPLTSSTVFTGSSIGFVADQDVDLVYASYGIDGATVTKFAADFANDEIDLIVASNFSAKEAYAWFSHIQATEQGINQFFGAVTAIDAGNLRINTGVVNLYFDTTASANVFQDDNIRIFRSDEAYPVKNPTTGGGAIDLVWRNQVYIAETGTSGLTPSEATTLSKIDALTENVSGLRFSAKALEATPTVSGGATLAEIEASTVIAKEATVATRLAANAYTTPDNAGITAIKAKTDRLAFNAQDHVAANVHQIQAAPLADIRGGLATSANVTDAQSAIIAEVGSIPTNPVLDSDTRLDNLDATVSSRLPTSAYAAPTDAPTASETATAVRSELATELGRIDATVSSRLATAGYTAPANSDIAAIKAKTDTLVNAPTLAQIEASDILSKRADLEVVNEGVKKASLLIPHGADLPV